MRGFNELTIIGNLGAPPEMRFTPSGKAVSNFTMAVNEKRGETETVEWFRVQAWEKLAEIVAEHLVKGSTVMVKGPMRSRKYTDKDGVERTTWEVTADKVLFLDSAPRNQDSEDFAGNRRAPQEESRRPAREDERRPTDSNRYARR